jgi:hypothetical protein
MKRTLALVMAVLVTSAGCGVVFVEGPHVVEAKVTCTQEFTLPLVDVAVAVVGIATPFVIEETRDRSKDAPPMAFNIALWGVGLAAAISSVIGIQKVKRCRRSVAAPLPASTPAPMPSPAP